MSSQTLLFKNVQTDLIKQFGQIIPLSRCINAPCRLDPDYVAACALSESITKKFVPSSKAVLTQTKEAALATFFRMNDRCNEAVSPSRLINEMRYISERDFHTVFDWYDLLTLYGIKNGPGASVLSKGRNSSFEKLFVNDLTTTNPFLYFDYIKYIKEHDTFHAAERKRRHSSGFAFRLVNGSNLSTVPKNDRTDRTICTEPSLNMIFQRALGDHIDSILRYQCGYDSALQPDRNRALARLGSLDGSIGTIDLSSASDTISMNLINEILPRWLVVAINDCRSPATSLDDQWYDLHMVSSMGNGFTFPLQTYIFTLVIRALCRIRSIKFDGFVRTLYGVFGDDIIVPTALYEPMIQALVSLGFIPNEEKSYNHGFFRESCGTDWYDGHDVRGVYIKTLSSKADRFSCVNRLMRFSARHSIRLSCTIHALLPSGWQRYIIPTDLADTCGIKVPTYLANCRQRSDGTFRYRALFARTRPFRFLRYDVCTDGRLIASHDNPFGFVISASASSIADGVARRAVTVSYDSTRAFSPFWCRRCDLDRFGISLTRWETSFMLNDISL